MSLRMLWAVMPCRHVPNYGAREVLGASPSPRMRSLRLGLDFAMVLLREAEKRLGDDASPHGRSQPGDGRFGWGTGSAVAFGCQIGWRLLAGGSGKWWLCQPLGLAGLQLAPFAPCCTRAHRSWGSWGAGLCQKGKLRHGTSMGLRRLWAALSLGVSHRGADGAGPVLGCWAMCVHACEHVCASVHACAQTQTCLHDHACA